MHRTLGLPLPCSRAGSQHRPPPPTLPGEGGHSHSTGLCPLQLKRHKSRQRGGLPSPPGTTGKEDGEFPLSQACLFLSPCFDASGGQPWPPPLQPQLLKRLLCPSACPSFMQSHQQPCLVPSFVSRTRNQAAPLRGCCTACLPPHARQCFSGIIGAARGAQHLASAPRPAAGIAHRGCHCCPVSSSLDAQP